MLSLIALGHYHVDENKLRDAVYLFNEKTGLGYEWPADFLHPFSNEKYSRLHQRISFMKAEARELFVA